MAQQKTILLADDHESLLELFKFYLEPSLGSDYKIVTAKDGKIVMEMVEDHEPDVLILDIMMPHMDGLAVCRELRKDKRHSKMKIVIVSALDTPDIKAAVKDLDIDDYFVKSADPMKLVESVKKAIERW